MTDKIPDEIMREAHHVRDELCIDCECKFDAGCGCLEAISRALMARDQRAAEIARNAGKFHLDAAKMGLSISPSPIIAKDRARITQQIAASILSYDEAQQ